MPPGGAMQDGESAAQAAIRELLEETGVSATIVPETELAVDYTFFWNGDWHPCRTHFFMALPEARPTKRPQLSREETFIEGASWIETPELLQELTRYPDLEPELKPWIQDWAEKKSPQRS